MKVYIACFQQINLIQTFRGQQINAALIFIFKRRDKKAVCGLETVKVNDIKSLVWRCGQKTRLGFSKSGVFVCILNQL